MLLKCQQRFTNKRYIAIIVMFTSWTVSDLAPPDEIFLRHDKPRDLDSCIPTDIPQDATPLETKIKELVLSLYSNDELLYTNTNFNTSLFGVDNSKKCPGYYGADHEPSSSSSQAVARKPVPSLKLLAATSWSLSKEFKDIKSSVLCNDERPSLSKRLCGNSLLPNQAKQLSEEKSLPLQIYDYPPNEEFSTDTSPHIASSLNGCKSNPSSLSYEKCKMYEAPHNEKRHSVSSTTSDELDKNERRSSHFPCQNVRHEWENLTVSFLEDSGIDVRADTECICHSESGIEDNEERVSNTENLKTYNTGVEKSKAVKNANGFKVDTTPSGDILKGLGGVDFKTILASPSSETFDGDSSIKSGIHNVAIHDLAHFADSAIKDYSVQVLSLENDAIRDHNDIVKDEVGKHNFDWIPIQEQAIKRSKIIIDLKERLRISECKYLQLKDSLSHKTEEFHKSESELSNVTSDLEKILHDLENSRRERNLLEEELQEMNQIKKTLLNDCNWYQFQIKTMTASRIKIEMTLEEANDQVRHLSDAVHELNGEKARMSDKITTMKQSSLAEKENILLTLSKLEEELVIESQHKEMLIQRSNELSQKLDEKDRHASSIEDKLVSVASSLASAEEEEKRLKTNIASKEGIILDLEKLKESLQQRILKQSNYVAIVEEEKEKLQLERNKLESQKEELQWLRKSDLETRASNEREIRELRTTLVELENERKSFCSAVQSLQTDINRLTVIFRITKRQLRVKCERLKEVESKRNQLLKALGTFQDLAFEKDKIEKELKAVVTEQSRIIKDLKAREQESHQRLKSQKERIQKYKRCYKRAKERNRSLVCKYGHLNSLLRRKSKQLKKLLRKHKLTQQHVECSESEANRVTELHLAKLGDTFTGTECHNNESWKDNLQLNSNSDFLTNYKEKKLNEKIQFDENQSKEASWSTDWLKENAIKTTKQKQRPKGTIEKDSLTPSGYDRSAILLKDFCDTLYNLKREKTTLSENFQVLKAFFYALMTCLQDGLLTLSKELDPLTATKSFLSAQMLSLTRINELLKEKPLTSLAELNLQPEFIAKNEMVEKCVSVHEEPKATRCSIEKIVYDSPKDAAKLELPNQRSQNGYENIMDKSAPSNTQSKHDTDYTKSDIKHLAMKDAYLKSSIRDSFQGYPVKDIFHASGATDTKLEFNIDTPKREVEDPTCCSEILSRLDESCFVGIEESNFQIQPLYKAIWNKNFKLKSELKIKSEKIKQLERLLLDSELEKHALFQNLEECRKQKVDISTQLHEGRENQKKQGQELDLLKEKIKTRNQLLTKLKSDLSDSPSRGVQELIAIMNNRLILQIDDELPNAVPSASKLKESTSMITLRHCIASLRAEVAGLRNQLSSQTQSFTHTKDSWRDFDDKVSRLRLACSGAVNRVPCYSSKAEKDEDGRKFVCKWKAIKSCAHKSENADNTI